MSKPAPQRGEDTSRPDEPSSAPDLVHVDELRPEGYEEGCLRPLGLCELGGCCDTCWYGSKRTAAQKR